MELILCFFEQLYGLKINFLERDFILCVSKAKEVEDDYRNIFGCEAASLPFEYIIIPMHYKKLLNKEWKLAGDHFE
jgi:hypothetical protein